VAEGWDEAEEAKVLSIGSVVGGVGPKARAWSDSISRLTRRVVAARSGVDSPLNLNVVFHVPGEVLPVDGEYVRTGRYDSRTRHLMVQVTVPESPPEDPDGLVLSRLAEAIAEAEEWVRRRGVADSLPGLHTVLDRLT
jgi:hypothetical protein